METRKHASNSYSKFIFFSPDVNHGFRMDFPIFHLDVVNLVKIHVNQVSVNPLVYIVQHEIIMTVQSFSCFSSSLSCTASVVSSLCIVRLVKPSVRSKISRVSVTRLILPHWRGPLVCPVTGYGRCRNFMLFPMMMLLILAFFMEGVVNIICLFNSP